MRKAIFCFLLLCPAAFAQKFDLAVLGGGQISFNPNNNVGTGAVIQGNPAFRLVHVPLWALHLEVPVTASFNIGSGLPAAVAAREFRTLFITPGLRLKFAPGSPVSPFLAAGGGWARYSPQNSALDSHSTGVVQFGAGVDFKIAPYVGLRTEVRDYYTGAPEIGLAFSERQNNVNAMAGLWLRF